MTVRMFRLEPGGSLKYSIRPVGGSARPPLSLAVRRPDEGPSSELELDVRPVAPLGVEIDVPAGAGPGRVPLDEGYLAVVLEVRRQIEELGLWGREPQFDLVYEEELDDGGRQAAGL